MNVQTGPATMGNKWRPIAWLALVTFMLNPLLVVAQTAGNSATILNPGDSVRLSVPGRSDLDQAVLLDAAGQVLIEPIGLVHLGGLSVDDAAQLLKQKLRLFYPTIDTIQLDYESFEKVRIYIIGVPVDRGVLTFAEVPSLWDVVRRIGGSLDSVNLNDARIISEVDGKPEVQLVDLSGVMEGKDLPTLLMNDGDTLILPPVVAGIPTVDSSDGVKVFGSVAVPTIVPITEGTRLMEVLMLAGAPTQTAEKTKISWVHNDGVRNQAKLIDLERYLLLGDELGNPLIYPGDTINVQFAQSSWVRTNVPFILGSLAAMATIYLAYDNVVNSGNP